MLEKLTDPRFRSISQPSVHALELAARVVSNTPDPVICEIGVGIGATSVELCRILNHTGQIWFFDFEDRLEELGRDLQAAGFTNFRMTGNSRRTFDSYGWTLAMLLRQVRDRYPDGLFDFVYLDGCHMFHHDAPATLCVKQLLKTGGYLLMDDYDWTIAASPTMRPSLKPDIVSHFNDEQIELSSVEMICSLFLDRDKCFERVPLDYRNREHRRAYRKTIG